MTMKSTEERLRTISGTLRWPLLLISLVVFAGMAVTSSRSLFGQKGAKSPSRAPANRAAAPLPGEALRKAQTLGAWTAPANLCATDGICVVGINAALLHTGQVLFYQYPKI